jgi:arylsulfatase
MPTARRRFVYRPPVSHIVSDVCPPVARGWVTEVDLEHPSGGGDGALVARGSINSGFVLYIKDGRLHFDYNAFHDHTRLVGAAPVAPGRRKIGLAVERRADGGGDVSISVDGAPVASGRIPQLLFLISSIGMDIGRSYAPVCGDYREPFAYPGRIHTVTFTLPDMPALRGETISQVRAAEAQQ